MYAVIKQTTVSGWTEGTHGGSSCDGWPLVPVCTMHYSLHDKWHTEGRGHTGDTSTLDI